ncbi:uncharacterized protein SCHCODRAFT_02515710 [Schizophyllum commune H4-8]|nr:uncharacterized protein SCHCODRAFT_02515710 [Schizophyllum commune H4-8]KAI5886953.1 hypothetical protein SCHCODRAFT_02515710 [Schizophyllum commune H4-8]
MSPDAVPLSALSFSEDAACIPVVERTLLTFDEAVEFQVIWTLEWCWGVERGGIPLTGPFNRMELRADMAKSFDEEDWTLMPTRKTLRAMSHLLRHNAQADASSRRNAMKAQKCKYKLKFVGHRKPGDEPTIYAAIGDAEPTAYKYPYKDLRIRSCAHPFIVVYKAHLIATDRHNGWNHHALESLHDNTLKISMRWRETPPAQFKYGPDFPPEHCHPGSIAGSVDGSSPRKRGSSDRPSDLPPTNALCSHSGSRSSLRKRKREDSDEEVDLEAPPRLCARTLDTSSLASLYADSTAVVSWLDMLEPGDVDYRCTPESAMAEADAALAQYVQEPARDPKEVMRTGWKPLKISRPLGQERDMSRWTSSMAAAWIAGVMIWGRYDDGSS